MADEIIVVDLDPYREKYRSAIPQEYADLIIEYFIVFSRFEYALKQTGFHNGSETHLEPDWDKFCNTFKEKFQPQKSETLTEAVNYYHDKPTKIQIFKDGQLQWRENSRGDGEDQFTWLMRTVRYTRNNLFHGGKFPYMPIRDTNLLTYGLMILYECLELDAELSRAFKS